MLLSPQLCNGTAAQLSTVRCPTFFLYVIFSHAAYFFSNSLTALLNQDTGLYEMHFLVSLAFLLSILQHDSSVEPIVHKT